ncbi:hypothetical protein E2C01_094395 [Portunus trituberculatus]|uniref:Uncharacterized protein n=1 Tax=Portunus trituberculatus TaxID=210409 RepID=A0A5B7JSC1_PORTR|nr:hypothetical protein [Portunus trituberculatus]
MEADGDTRATIAKTMHRSRIPEAPVNYFAKFISAAPLFLRLGIYVESLVRGAELLTEGCLVQQ